MRKASQLRIGLLMGLSVIAMAAPALAQSPSRPAKKPAIKSAAITTPITMGEPHTLDQALATVYMNQPVLQAERAKLRATDEDVPQAEAGWKPTVIVAGSAGYGDGVTRQFLANRGMGKNPNGSQHRHRPGHPHAAALYRRQDRGERQSCQRPRDG